MEIRQQRSVNLTLAPFTYEGITVNLLDTPGYADFTGDLRAGLRRLTFRAVRRLGDRRRERVTQMLWEECTPTVGMPRAVVITKIDHQRADYAAALEACRAAFGEGVAPLYLPVGGGPSGGGGLSRADRAAVETLYDYSSGSRATGSPEGADADRMAEERDSLIEGIIAESEASP